MNKIISITKRRISISTIFFFYGFIFATWASRIPAIQSSLKLSEAALGGILFSMPLGSFLTLPFSGLLVSKIGSRKVVIFASLLYAIDLILVGNAASILQLSVTLFIFGSSGNMMNIAINTQAIALEELYGKKIISSFHGMWSSAGLCAALLGTYLTGHSFPVASHFLMIGLIVITGFILSYNYLLSDKIGKHKSGPLFQMPDKAFLNLGFIAFCSMMCQGAMFDWTGIYFKKVLHTDKSLIGIGYTAFMIAMASTRFITDWITNRIGFRTIIIACGVFTMAGLMITFFFPYIVPATIGIFMVGIGVSPVVPLVFSEAGKSRITSPGIAIAAVATMGFVGLMIGPPMIGFIAAATSLKISFLILSFIGLLVTVCALFIKRLK